jgi:hypothetical protein
VSAKRVSEMTDDEIRTMAAPPTLYTKFIGGWCDRCSIASRTTDCPDCGDRMRPAQIEIVPLEEQ